MANALVKITSLFFLNTHCIQDFARLTPLALERSLSPVTLTVLQELEGLWNHLCNVVHCCRISPELDDFLFLQTPGQLTSVMDPFRWTISLSSLQQSL